MLNQARRSRSRSRTVELQAKQEAQEEQLATHMALREAVEERCVALV